MNKGKQRKEPEKVRYGKRNKGEQIEVGQLGEGGADRWTLFYIN